MKLNICMGCFTCGSQAVHDLGSHVRQHEGFETGQQLSGGVTVLLCTG